MRIGHCQYDSQLGDFEGNLAKVVAGLERAQREQVEIVSFPECFLTSTPRLSIEAGKWADPCGALESSVSSC